MRYELTDFEWAATRSLLPNKPCGIPRVDDRRVLNGIWVLRSGAPWRDLPETYGSRTTCYNALATGHDAPVQMIDTSVVRVHRHGACIARNREELMGLSRGGLTSKIHAVVDAVGLPVHLGLTPRQAYDNRLCPELLAGLQPQLMLLADRMQDSE